MEAVQTADGMFQIKLDSDEMLAINNCMNEVCNGVALPDFAVKIGEEIEIVRNMLQILSAAFRNETA